MTRKTFYQKLRQVNYRFKWKFDGEKIRAYPKSKKVQENVGEFGFCPITAVNFAITGNIHTVGQFDVAGRELGIASEDFFPIVSVADGDIWEVGYPNIRKTLLASVGLKEKAPQA